MKSSVVLVLTVVSVSCVVVIQRAEAAPGRITPPVDEGEVVDGLSKREGIVEALKEAGVVVNEDVGGNIVYRRRRSTGGLLGALGAGEVVKQAGEGVKAVAEGAAEIVKAAKNR